ncbi:MAG: hypothetical protein ACRD7E_11900, partial [Bryobacteraceae bacterium]
YKSDYNNFAPNIGLAWDIFGDGKTSFRAGYAISYINDNVIAALENNVFTNSGLSQSVVSSGLSARIGSGLPAIETPEFRVPLTFADNYALDRTSAVGLPDPNLATPYVQQWTAGIQRELAGNVFEFRYVANKATKLYRGLDFNQVDIQAYGFFEDFLRARSNGNLALAAIPAGGFNPAYNPDIPGSQPLTVISQLPSGGNLNNATYRGYIARGEVGEYANSLQVDGRNGEFSFFRNPFTQGANVMTNLSNSTYHSFQFEARRRLRHGIQLQGSYVYGKVLSDAGAETDAQFEPLLDNGNLEIERARAPHDLTHAIKANGVWQIPVGAGHELDWRPLRFLIGGWTVGGMMTWQSGMPFSVLSRRATLNRGGLRSNQNTANTNLTKSELDELFEFRMTGDGPFLVAESARSPRDGSAVAPDGADPFPGQAFFHPEPGTLGGLQRRMFSGPWVFNLDASLIKRI